MKSSNHNWPTILTPSYRRLADIFRPVFADIAKGSRERDHSRLLPQEQITQLNKLKFGAILLSPEQGGLGASWEELFALLIELAEADSNVAQIYRAHFGLLGQLITKCEDLWSKRCIEIIAAGNLISASATEIGNSTLNKFSSTITQSKKGYLLNGRKYYTTGVFYSEWTTVSAIDDEGEPIMALVKTSSLGTTILDDWNGFGQKLTASGTAIFENVVINDEDIAPSSMRWPFLTAFAQLAHLATLVGIGRAAASDAAKYVVARKRTYSHAAASTASSDPQVLQLIGTVFSNVYGANTMTSSVALIFQKMATGELGDRAAIGNLELEIYQAQVIVNRLILDATTILFDGLGASALSNDLGLDRYWRNARAICSHNPIIYKERQIGDFVVNEILPQELWTTGVSKNQ